MYSETDHTGVFLSRKALMSLQPEVRTAVLDIVFRVPSAPRLDDGDEQSRDNVSASVPATSSDDDEGFAELSARQARRFLEGCGTKTHTAVEVMAKSSSRFFQVADIASALGVKAPELRGVWGGLTRRVQTITGDTEAYLISWRASSPVFDEDDKYADQRGELTEMTYQSFRKALGL